MICAALLNFGFLPNPPIVGYCQKMSRKVKKMKIVQVMKRFGVSFAAASAFLAGNAHAALPASVTTDIGTAAADALTLGGLILGLVVGVAVFKHIRAAK